MNNLTIFDYILIIPAFFLALYLVYTIRLNYIFYKKNRKKLENAKSKTSYIYEMVNHEEFMEDEFMRNEILKEKRLQWIPETTDKIKLAKKMIEIFHQDYIG